jgi:hypothetical protein
MLTHLSRAWPSADRFTIRLRAAMLPCVTCHTQEKYDRSGEGRMDVRELRAMLLELQLPLAEVDKMLTTSTNSTSSTLPLATSTTSRSLLSQATATTTNKNTNTAATINRRRPTRSGSLRLTERVLREYDVSGDKQLDLSEFAVLLTKIIAHLTRNQPIDRNQGAWAMPAADAAEPARTERLLATPFALWRHHPADVVDQLGFHLWFRTHGASSLGVYWCWGTMLVQAVCAVLIGIGPYLHPSSSAAHVQVLSVAAIKLLWALFLLTHRVCNDHLVGRMVFTMFTFEGTATILTYVAAQSTTSAATAASAQSWALWLLLLPVFMPMTQFVYDGVVVSVIVACCRNKFSLKMAIILCAIIFSLSIPSFLARAFGCVCPGLTTFSSSKTIGASVMVINDAEKQIKARKQGAVVIGQGAGDGDGKGDGGDGDGGDDDGGDGGDG